VDPAPAARPALDAARLSRAGEDLGPGVVVEVVDRAASSQALVAERARAGAPAGLVVAVEEQTAGRGRLDRTWVTPRGAALTFSVLLRPATPVETWPWVPLLTGYAVAKALRARGVPASVKWPNDVLVGDLKVAGILAELVATPAGPAGAAVVVGIGLNVAQAADELPVPTATSLDLASGSIAGAPADRTEVLLEVLAAVWEAVAAWEAGGEAGADRLRASYVAACATVGRRVRVDLPAGQALEGEATGVDAEGRLLVLADGGSEARAVAAGDVVHVRARTGSVP